MRSLVAGGAITLGILAAVPVVVGLVAWLLDGQGQKRVSQIVANAGIAFGLLSVVVLVCTLIWGARHGMSAVEDVGVVWLLIPVYLTVAGFVVEHKIHPDRQETIRAQIRRGVLIVIVLALVYWVVSRMRFWALIHTSWMGLVFFLAVLAGILYFLVRKLI